MTDQLERNPNLRCLFTKDDWEVWEQIDERKKEKERIHREHLRHLASERRWANISMRCVFKNHELCKGKICRKPPNQCKCRCHKSA